MGSSRRVVAGSRPRHTREAARPEVATLTAPALRDRSACLLRNHGVLAIGPSVEHAYNAASTVEGVADAYLRARAFGPVPEIPADDVRRIRREQWAPAWTTDEGGPTHGG